MNISICTGARWALPLILPTGLFRRRFTLTLLANSYSAVSFSTVRPFSPTIRSFSRWPVSGSTLPKQTYAFPVNAAGLVRSYTKDNIPLFLQKKSRAISTGSELAEKLVKYAPSEYRDYVQEIVACEGFYKDPTDYFLRVMIKCCEEDQRLSSNRAAGLKAEARGYILPQIPGFMDQVTSLSYLERFGQSYLSDKAFNVFMRSIKSEPFCYDINMVIGHSHYEWSFQRSMGSRSCTVTEGRLRNVLTIFPRSERGQPYQSGSLQFARSLFGDFDVPTS